MHAVDVDARSEHVIQLEHGKPLIFGKNRDKGIRRKSDGDIEVVQLGNGISESDWFNDNAPEGDAVSADPRHPEEVYTTTYTSPEFSGILLGRFNRETGQTQIVAPATQLSGVDEYTSFTNTINVLASQHHPGVIYMGATAC